LKPILFLLLLLLLPASSFSDVGRFDIGTHNQKQEVGDCFSKPKTYGLSPESIYLRNHFYERLEVVRVDDQSKSAILCVPIPDTGTIPKVLNDIFNIEAVSQLIGQALGTGERPVPKVDISINAEHAFFEEEIPEFDEVGEDNKQEIRATGVLKFFDLIPDWLVSQLDASLVPFEDRWLATLDINLKSIGHIIVTSAPVGMILDPITNRRIIVTAFMRGTVNTNDNVPYPMDVELDYDPILGALDEDIDIPGSGQNTILSITELYDSGNTIDEQIEALKNADKEQENFMDAVVDEVIASETGDEVFLAVEDDELFEVELTLTGHRKDVIDLNLEQQVAVYVDPKHIAYAKAQLSDNLFFLTGDFSLSFGFYNPGAPPEDQENIEKNDYLKFYVNIKESNGGTLRDAIILSGKPLLMLAKLKLPNHLPKRKPTGFFQQNSN